MRTYGTLIYASVSSCWPKYRSIHGFCLKSRRLQLLMLDAVERNITVLLHLYELLVCLSVRQVCRAW